jgi:hypothetical protein
MFVQSTVTRRRVQGELTGSVFFSDNVEGVTDFASRARARKNELHQVVQRGRRDNHQKGAHLTGPLVEVGQRGRTGVMGSRHGNGEWLTTI